MKQTKNLNLVSIKYFSFSILFGVSLLVLSYYVNKDMFRSLDYEVMIWLQSFFSRTFDLPFSILTLSGSSEITLLLFVFIFIYVFFRSKKIFLSLFLFFSMIVIELLGKLFIYHPVPPPLLNRNVLPIHLPSSYFVHTNFSYPSGHMSRSAFMVGILIFLIWKHKGRMQKKLFWFIILAVYLVSMFVSRIYLGEHWLTDVLGGLLLGGGISALSIALY